jgi:2'-5' RNA ligase
MPRLFVAVVPPDGVLADLDRALIPLRGAAGEPRWIPPERWHVTLLFLGKVPEERVAELRDAVGRAVGRASPFTLRLAGAGRFGAGRRPQVFWTGVDGDVAPLTDLVERLHAGARELGLPVEDRPFRPHLTVGRWRPRRPLDAALPDRLAGYRGPDWPVTEVALLASHLGRYDAVTTWPLTTRTP